MIILYLLQVSITISSVGKESACHVGDPGSIPRAGRSAGERIGYPLQYSWASLVVQLVKKIPWRRERLSTLVFWPGKVHGVYSAWGHKESDMTEGLALTLSRS